MPAPIRVTTSLGTPRSDIWAAVCSVAAAVYGEGAWAVSQPEMAHLLYQRGYALAVAQAGSSLVGFSSAVCVTADCASEVMAAGYEERPLTSKDVLSCGESAYWYGTSTCLLPEWRGKGLGTSLLAARLKLVAEASHSLPLVTVFGQIWSPEGRATFARFGAVAAGPVSMRVTAPPAELAGRALGFAG